MLLSVATDKRTQLPRGELYTNMALNNAENLVTFYKDKGEKIEIEFVAYGAGLNMVRSDTSPVRERLAAISNSMKNVTFTDVATL